MGKHETYIYRDRFRIGKLRKRTDEGRKAVYFVRVFDLDTRSATKIYSDTSNREKARQFIHKQCDLLAGPGVERVGFASAFEEWLQVKKPEIRPSTYDDYETTFEGILKPEFGSLRVDQITLIDVDAFFERVKTEVIATGKPRSVRTRRKHLTLLRSFFKWCIHPARQYAVSDPTQHSTVKGKLTRRTGYRLTEEEARRLLRACKEPVIKNLSDGCREDWAQSFPPPKYLHLAVLIGLHTGLRLGNIRCLTWGEVKWGAKKRIEIPGAKMKNHQDHEVPFHPELEMVLRDVRARGKVDPAALVLNKKLLSLDVALKGAAKRADLPPLGWHDLRRTFGTWVGEVAPEAVTKALLGHAPSDVIDRYVKPKWATLVDWISKLPRLIDDGNKAGRDAASE